MLPTSPNGAENESGVGVIGIGIGGLGHLAIKFARAMGAHVTAFSTSENKKNEAREFGAHEFCVWGEGAKRCAIQRDPISDADSATLEVADGGLATDSSREQTTHEFVEFDDREQR